MNTLMPATPLLLQAQRLLRAFQAHRAEARRRDQDRSALAEMGARELSDLGLGRGEIERVAATTSARWAD